MKRLMGFALTWAAVTGLQAQTLPDIKPNEVEIRTARPIELPDLKRPPITQLVVPPRPYLPPDTRMPLIVPVKQRPTELAHSGLTDLQADSRFSLTSASPRDLMVKASLGRFWSRELEAVLNVPVLKNGDLLANLKYDGASGYQPFAAKPTLKAPYNRFDAAAALLRTVGKSTASAGLEGFFAENKLFGADTAHVVGPDILPQPTRSGLGFGLNAGLYGNENAALPYQVKLRYTATRYVTDLFAVLPETYKRIENALDLSAGSNYTMSKATFFAHGRAMLAALDNDALGANRLLVVDGGVESFVTEKICVRLGLMYAGMTASKENTGNASSSGRYISPILKGEYYPNKRVKIYLANMPSVTPRSLDGVLQLNPYLIDAPAVMPDVQTVNLEGGASFQREPYRYTVKAGFVHSPNFLYFTKTDQNRYAGYVRGVFQPNYHPADYFFVGAEGAVNLFSSIWANASVTLRDGRLVGQNGQPDTTIPYFAALLGNGSVSYRFLQDKARLQAGFQAESRRYTDPQKTKSLLPFVDLHLEGSYEIAKQYAIFAQAKHAAASPLEHWEGYPEARFILMAGFKSALALVK